jgi:hypothetical protein
MRRLLLIAAVISAAGCKCDKVMSVKPSLGVSPPALDFGPVKNGTMSTLSLQFTAQTNADVNITNIALSSGTDPGGAEAFTVQVTPIMISPMSSVTLPVTFSPTVLEAYSATLTLQTNDEDKPTVRIPFTGSGSKPILKVVPDCSPSRMCQGTVVVDPPSIDFGAQPFMPAMMVDASKLPDVEITNEGDVQLTITDLEITGTDAAAFQIQGAVSTPLTYDPSAGVNVPIRFSPTSEAQQTYAADLLIASDDPDHAMVTVHLTGSLRPNLPPTVCANLIHVQPIDDVAIDYSSPADWAPLLMPPAGGYDFTTIRDVPPRSTVTLSAISDATNMMACTSDPEDGRTGLTYQWVFTTTPPGSPMLPMSATPTFTFSPIVVGQYGILLTVTDKDNHATMVPIRFAVALKQDLVAQLQWTGFANVDLDLHLVRPSAVSTPSDPFSGVFSYFDEGTNHSTSGDINGYSVNKQKNTAGLDFDWGVVGTPDDPKLNIDDIGMGALLENISLNYPERDAMCDGGRCRYKVLVHYFRDYRLGNDGPCTVDGGTACKDGDQCDCSMSGDRCVAAPPADGGAPIGAGECRPAPAPVVKIFLKGNPTPAATIPMPTGSVVMGAPCQMFYVADVNWPSQQEIGSLPDGGTPPADVFVHDGGFALFGKRSPGDLRQCSPDVMLTSWYSEQP